MFMQEVMANKVSASIRLDFVAIAQLEGNGLRFK
jgi:hypothetical protein